MRIRDKNQKTWRWIDFADIEPEMAERCERRFSQHPHHVLATINRDGEPCIWGISVNFHAGELWIGSPAETKKMKDIRRRKHCALHSAPLDGNLFEADIAIKAVGETLAETAGKEWLGRYHSAGGPAAIGDEGEVAFLRIQEVRITYARRDELITDLWTPEEGKRQVSRKRIEAA